LFYQYSTIVVYQVDKCTSIDNLQITPHSQTHFISNTRLMWSIHHTTYTLHTNKGTQQTNK